MFIPRAQRSMKRLELFKSPECYEEIFSTKWLSEFIQEGPIGYYQNDPKDSTANVFFSNQAIYFFINKDWERLAYTEIQSLVSEKTKEAASIIRMKCTNDRIYSINISGEQDGFRDYFTVYQFLHRILGDMSEGSRC